MNSDKSIPETEQVDLPPQPLAAASQSAASLKLRQQRLIEDLLVLHDLELLSEPFMETLLAEAPELRSMFVRK